jgi:hypothetical protein
MTHREFLVWLRPRLEGATATGLGPLDVRAIRDELEWMRANGALRPFASWLLGLVSDCSTLDAKTVSNLAGVLRFELAPPREQTVVLATERSEK